jgi:hypothetical protein
MTEPFQENIDAATLLLAIVVVVVVAIAVVLYGSILNRHVV